MIGKAKVKNLKVGNLYAIPGGGKFAFGKVLYLSDYFKDLMLVRFFDKAVAAPDELPQQLDSLPSRLIYTGTGAINRGGWLFLRCDAVSEQERSLSRRIVGGDVWFEDQHLGPASDDDRKTLKNMDIFGHLLIEKAVAKLA